MRKAKFTESRMGSEELSSNTTAEEERTPAIRCKLAAVRQQFADEYVSDQAGTNTHNARMLSAGGRPEVHYRHGLTEQYKSG